LEQKNKLSILYHRWLKFQIKWKLVMLFCFIRDVAKKNRNVIRSKKRNPEGLPVWINWRATYGIKKILLKGKEEVVDATDILLSFWRVALATDLDNDKGRYDRVALIPYH